MAPARQPLDEAWVSHMLAGEYGQWFDGEKRPFTGRDEIFSSPVLASGTRYGISTSNQSAVGGAGWSTVGGLLGRALRPGASIELFGREIVRAHGMKRTVTPPDFSYEFYLVVRPSPTGRGKITRKWTFGNEDLLLRTAPGQIEGLPPNYPPDARRSLESEGNKRFYIYGALSFDPARKTATVTITGLVRPFEERVDLSREVP